MNKILPPRFTEEEQKYIRDGAELMTRVKNASNREIGIIFNSLGYENPFAGSLLLPSVIRKEAIDQIQKWIKQGKVHFKKDN